MKMVPSSQHLFIVFGETVEFHKMLGGQVADNDGLVHSQIGPFLIVGLTRRFGRSVSDLRIWKQSEVHWHGGTITPLGDWRVGQNVTQDLAKLLARHQRKLVKNARLLHEQAVKP
jgi:hypothetical protein